MEADYMQEKICTKCSIQKLESCFSWKNKSKRVLSPVCKECQNAYHRQHYLLNIVQYKQRAINQQKELTEILKKFKQKSCADCGIAYPSWVMQYDHVRGVKILEVSILVRHGSKKKLLEEINKCDVVCANCHAQRTHDRLMTF